MHIGNPLINVNIPHIFVRTLWNLVVKGRRRKKRNENRLFYSYFLSKSEKISNLEENYNNKTSEIDHGDEHARLLDCMVIFRFRNQERRFNYRLK